MRIKVRVADLITKIEESRDAAIAEYEKAKEKFEGKTSDQDVKVDLAIRALATREEPFDAKDVWQDYAGGRYVWVVQIKLPRGFEKADTPSKVDTSGYNRDISLLKMAAVEELAISVTDRYARYL